MLAAGRRIGVAVSGGADSVFLLHALHELGAGRPRFFTSIIDCAAPNRMPTKRSSAISRFASACPSTLLERPSPTGNIEQEARRARYDFFPRQIASGNCDAVATGHTLDDQAETVLLPLPPRRRHRGPQRHSPGNRNPASSGRLIELRRSEIRAWLAERNIPWREDRSNSNPELRPQPHPAPASARTRREPESRRCPKSSPPPPPGRAPKKITGSAELDRLGTALSDQQA